MISRDEDKTENTSKQTSPVAKIRQFIGIENNADSNMATKSSSENMREEVINGISPGKTFL